jgi:hypothetical protein
MMPARALYESACPHGSRDASTAGPRRAPIPSDEPDVVELESVELSGVFSAPQWLRDLGFASWLLAGVGAVLIGATWVAALTSTIFVPVVVAGVVAAVTSPLVRSSSAAGSRAPRARRSSSSACSCWAPHSW